MASSGVALPCQNSASWEEDKTLFTLLSGLRSLREFSELLTLHTHTREDSSPLHSRLARFSGLLVFLEKYCNEEERAVFFELTLPFIAEAAACLKERVPESGVPFLRRQESASLVLGRQLVVSLLANAFLCTFPDKNTCTSGAPPPQHSEQQQQQTTTTTTQPQQEDDDDEEEEDVFPFTFFGLYSRLQKSTKKPAAVAAKLKCILAYFHRLAENKCDLGGAITVRRQVLPLSEVPSLETWQASRCHLCSISVDNSRGIEDSGSHTLQVDFANRCVSGSTLEGGCVQEEIRFAICPELLVSRLVLELLEDNEAVVITGAERFANYKGYGKTLQCDGEHVDQSDRDMFGNILTSIVAIDAVPFLKDLSPDEQFTDHYLQRELNKAFAGFLCPHHDRGDLSTELIALRVQNDVTQLVFSENHPPPAVSPDAYSTSRPSAAIGESASSLENESGVAYSLSGKSSTEPLSPIKEVSESSAHSPLPATSVTSSPCISVEPFQISSLVNSIVMSGVEMATSSGTSGRATDHSEKTVEKGGKGVDDYANKLSGFILSKVLSKEKGSVKPAEKESVKPAEKESVKAKDRGQSIVDDFASKLSKSLLSSVVSEPAEIKDEHSKPSKVVAEKLTNSLFSEIPSLTRKNETGEGDRAYSCVTDTADTLARSIISDVLSQDGAVPSTPPVSPQTVGQSTSPVNEWRVHSYADHVADGIISSVLEDTHQPPVVLNRQKESAQSSRSSSLTGQTIILHEFTDDLVEGIMREGILIASLQARGTERASMGGGGNGDRGDEGESEEGTGEVNREGGESEGHEIGKSEGACNPSDLAEFLVAQSIQSVLEDGRKRGKNEREKSGPHHSPGRTRRAESPMHPSKTGLLRHTLEKPKFASLSSETDLEQSTSSSLFHLSAPSSRMSYAWSVASTRDEESRPVSPSDLDRMALSFVGSMEEYCSMFAELVIRSAIAEVTGNKKYMCHVPIKAHSHSDSLYTTGDVRIQVPTIYSHQESRLDTFLSTLDEAEPLGRGDIGEGKLKEGFTERSPALHRVLLRPVATGNWGCGAFGGDPQLKSMLQWAAVSAAGRPEMMYFPFNDKRMEQFTHVTSHLHTKQWTVGQLLSAVTDFCHLSKEDREQKSLFSQLLEQ